MIRLTNARSLGQIKVLAAQSNRLVYGFSACWWKVGDPVYSHDESGLPCGPRGEMLLETDDPMSFIAAAEANPAHYGKHGLDAFVAAYHGNTVTETGLPTSLETWDEYNKLLDEAARPMESPEPEPCKEPCPPEERCSRCEEYWNRMTEEGLWKDREGWTDKALKEWTKP